MDCKHDISMLVGIADGVMCKGCGKIFDHIPKQDEAKVVADEKPEAPKKTARKTAAKKGAK